MEGEGRSGEGEAGEGQLGKEDSLWEVDGRPYDHLLHWRIVHLTEICFLVSLLLSVIQQIHVVQQKKG